MTTFDTPKTEAFTDLTFAANGADDSVGSGAGSGAGPRKRPRPWWPFVLAALVVLVGTSLLFPAGRHQWAVSFARQPTDYTALSFVDAGHLPSTIVAGNPVRLSFSVANHEGTLTRNPYVVTSANVGATNSTVLARATVTVPAGGQRTESITVTPVCTASSCQIKVSLPGHSEAIDVLVHVDRPTG